jgi:hypothetical protein
MTDESAHPDGPAIGAANARSLPPVVDRATFQAELDRLRVREKATPAKATRSRGAAHVAHLADRDRRA